MILLHLEIPVPTHRTGLLWLLVVCLAETLLNPCREQEGGSDREQQDCFKTSEWAGLSPRSRVHGVLDKSWQFKFPHLASVGQGLQAM